MKIVCVNPIIQYEWIRLAIMWRLRSKSSLSKDRWKLLIKYHTHHHRCCWNMMSTEINCFVELCCWIVDHLYSSVKDYALHFIDMDIGSTFELMHIKYSTMIVFAHYWKLLGRNRRRKKPLCIRTHTQSDWMSKWTSKWSIFKYVFVCASLPLWYGVHVCKLRSLFYMNSIYRPCTFRVCESQYNECTLKIELLFAHFTSYRWLGQCVSTLIFYYCIHHTNSRFTNQTHTNAQNTYIRTKHAPHCLMFWMHRHYCALLQCKWQRKKRKKRENRNVSQIRMQQQWKQ